MAPCTAEEYPGRIFLILSSGHINHASDMSTRNDVYPREESEREIPLTHTLSVSCPVSLSVSFLFFSFFLSLSFRENHSRQVSRALLSVPAMR